MEQGGTEEAEIASQEEIEAGELREIGVEGNDAAAVLQRERGDPGVGPEAVGKAGTPAPPGHQAIERVLAQELEDKGGESARAMDESLFESLASEACHSAILCR